MLNGQNGQPHTGSSPEVSATPGTKADEAGTGGNVENLLACYRSGQMSEAQWEQHCRDTPGLREASRGEARVWRGHALLIERDEDSWLASAPDLPGCIATGDTPHAALTSLHGTMASWLAVCEEHGVAVPPPAYPAPPTQQESGR